MTSTVYRDLHGTGTVKFGTAVYRGYRDYRPSLILMLVIGENLRCKSMGGGSKEYLIAAVGGKSGSSYPKSLLDPT